MMVTGGAQLLSITITVLRTKVLAVLLGPGGLGLLSLYTNLQQMLAVGFGLGIESSAVREVAVKRAEAGSLTTLRRVLFAGNLAQGLLAMLFVWIFREPLSRAVLGDVARADDVGLVGVSVVFTLLAAAQTALLRGMLRISDLSRVVVLSSVAGTVIGLILVAINGEAGLIAFVLAQPLSAVWIAFHYTRKLPRLEPESWPSFSVAWTTWKPMAALGVVFMLGGLASTTTVLVVRSLITQALGLDAVGQFAASWSITMTYVGFLLQAMGADYLPRLSQVINDSKSANKLVNDQAQLGMALGGPILLFLLGGAPWLIRALYSGAFDDAVVLLRWQTVGNIFKLACWPVGFMFVASAQGRMFLLLQMNFNGLFLLLLWLGLPIMGLRIAGIAFLAAYIGQFAVLNVAARRYQRFQWEGLSLWLISMHAALAVILLLLAYVDDRIALVVSLCSSFVTAAYGVRVVLGKIGTAGRIPSFLARVYENVGWPVEKVK